MYYEINVAHCGTHFFATSDRSVTSKSQLKAVYSEIIKKFPESEGYSVTVSFKQHTGRGVDMKGFEDDRWQPFP